MLMSSQSEASPHILIVDSNPDQRASLAETVRSFGWHPETADDGVEAMEIMRRERADVVITELMMPRMNGAELISRLRSAEDAPPVVVLTQVRGVGTGLRCMHEFGAFWYFEKPAPAEALKIVLDAAIQIAKHVTRKALSGSLGIIGESTSIRRVRSMIEKAAPRDVTVFIVGETGTGKELAAKAVHQCSPRSVGPFVAVNCAAVSESLLEAEFFGSEKGAFTGSVARRAGFFEQAHEGTILLDEIGDLPTPFQPKLLRVLEDHRVRRVGGMTELQFNFRVLVSTNRLEAGHGLRADLFQRLDCFHLVMPPLREHPDDIPTLIQHFLFELNRKHQTSVHQLAPELTDQFLRYSWPGNVRELLHVLEEAVIRADPGTEVFRDHLPDKLMSLPQSGVPDHNTHSPDGKIA